MTPENNRKIAANYIYWPDVPLVKNGYLELLSSGLARVVDTGGEIKEMAGLEFYGGLLVPDWVAREIGNFTPGEALLPVLDKLFASAALCPCKAAIIEGADLRALTWKAGARIRLL